MSVTMIYFIQERCRGGMIKIGYTSKNPYERMAYLQTGNPRELCLIGFVEGRMSLEGEIHAELTRSRVSGEWFYPGADVKNLIREFVPGVRFVDSKFINVNTILASATLLISMCLALVMGLIAADSGFLIPSWQLVGWIASVLIMFPIAWHLTKVTYMDILYS